MVMTVNMAGPFAQSPSNEVLLRRPHLSHINNCNFILRHSAKNIQSEKTTASTIMLRHCRATAARVQLRKEREQVLTSLPKSDALRLKNLFTLWDSFPYADYDYDVLPTDKYSKYQAVNKKPKLLVLPPEETGCRSAIVADSLSKIPPPVTMPSLESSIVAIKLEDLGSETIPKKTPIRKFLTRVVKAVCRSFAKD